MLSKYLPKEAINASSMADIAFLLLIFFLVTTTMNVETGLPTILPPITDEEELVVTHKQEREALMILINAKDQLLVGDKITPIEELRILTKEHVNNYGKEPHLSTHPKKAFVSLKNDKQTSYNTYIEVLNELRGAYNELREEYAQQKFDMSFKQLPKAHQKHIRDQYPLRISEAEPEHYVEENVSKYTAN